MLGEGKAPAKFWLALQHVASNKEDPKWVEAKFYSLGVFAKLKISGIGPWEIPLWGPGMCSEYVSLRRFISVELCWFSTEHLALLWEKKNLCAWML